MLFFLSLILSFAHAEETPTVSITVDGKTTEFLLLASGTRLDFSTPGPKKIAVESRRRMAGAAQRAGTAPITAEGDGNLILTIRVPGSAVAGGQINDQMGGYPSKPDRSVVTVPDGGEVLTIEAPIGGPDFFIRVVDRTWPDRLVIPIHSSLIGEDIGDPDIVENEDPPPVQEDEFLSDEVVQEQPQQPRRSPDAPDDLRPAAGMLLGFGIPARGNKMVFALAATGRYPVYKDLISAGGSLGWHRIAVEEEVAIANPISGDLTYSANWHTTVVPIVGTANIHVPFPAGPITPVASAGLGMYIATRAEGANKVTNLALGPTFGLGAEADIQIGQIQAMLTWHEARAQFGNQATDGSVVRESLAVSQFNVSYLYVF
jgi:hypothetical protein